MVALVPAVDVGALEHRSVQVRVAPKGDRLLLLRFPRRQAGKYTLALDLARASERTLGRVTQQVGATEVQASFLE